MRDFNVVPIKPAAADPKRRLGTIELGSFRLDEVIGRGIHATTYVATQLGFDRRAVVKIAHPELFESRNDEIVRRRYADELRAATRVAHPNLVTLYTAGETSEGLPAIAMELVSGELLEGLLDAHPGGLPVTLLEPIFTQLVGALAALHEHGLVHRELSAHGVMVELAASVGSVSELEIKVLDFGLSMLRGHSRRTSPAATKRDPVAPELHIGRSVPASDMFAVGVILWRALTGQEYRRQTFTVEDLREREVLDHADPRSVAPGLPARMATLVGDLLAHAEHERPTANEFLASWPQAVAELVATSAPSHAQLATPPRLQRRPSPRGGTAELAAVLEPVQTSPPQLAPLEPYPLLGFEIEPPTYDSLPLAVRPGPPEIAAPVELGPRVLVVDSNPITAHLLAGCLRRNGCRVHGTHDPREATRSLPDEYDLVVLSTQIPDADALDIARYLQEYHPQQWVVLAGDGELDEAMLAAGVRELLPVSAGLRRLGEVIELLRGELVLRPPAPNEESDAVEPAVLDALQAEDPMGAREVIELFVGQTPECIARIAEGHQHRDGKAVCEECRVLATSARALGANRLARLAQAAVEIVREGELEHMPGFVAEIEREYGLVFRALRATQVGSMSRAPGRSR